VVGWQELVCDLSHEACVWDEGKEAKGRGGLTKNEGFGDETDRLPSILAQIWQHQGTRQTHTICVCVYEAL